MKISRIIFGVFMAAVLAVSCKPDPITPEDPAPEIKVTGATSTITFQAEALPVTFKVKGNYDWTASVSGENSNWLDVSPLTGKANEEVTVTATASNNEAKEARTAKITFKVAEKDYSVEITANQLGKEGPDYDSHTKGHVFWSEDFSWITENWPAKHANSKYGWISVKTDGTNYNEFQFGAAGYEDITAIMTEKGLGYDTSEQFATYGKYEGFIKLGKTKWVGFVTSPALESIDEGTLATLEVKWDASLYVAANGNPAANAYQKISVIGEGTIVACGTENATISEDGKTATVPVLYEGEYLWRWVRKTIIVKDATAETKIQFGMLENLDARSFVDNLSVARTIEETATAAADELLPLAALDSSVGTVPEEAMGAETGAGTWTVRVNRGWKVESSAEWLTIDKVACNTDVNGVSIAENKLAADVPATGLIYKVYYKLAANEATAPREATLTVTAEGQTIGSVTVKQAAYVPPTGTVTTVAKWSWTGLYKDNADYPALADIANAWLAGDPINSDIVAGGVFSAKANANAAFSTGTSSQKKDRLRVQKMDMGDYFEFKVNGLTLKENDIIRFKNAGLGITAITKGVAKWIIEYSFDGNNWTKSADLELTGANKAFSLDTEVVVPVALNNGTFYLRIRANEELSTKGDGSAMCMVMINGDSNVSENNKYYTDDWAFIYFETETY
jgi:hypothetical protein